MSHTGGSPKPWRMLMEKMSGVKAIKTFFERTDQFAPQGGRVIPMSEMQELMKVPGAKQELEKLCAEALGVELG